MFGGEEVLFLIIPFCLLLLFILRGRQIFEYDSDGEAVNFKNRNFTIIRFHPHQQAFPCGRVYAFLFSFVDVQ